MSEERAEFANRYVARMLLRPPWPPPVYVRPTDEQIEELPEDLQQIARVHRELDDQLAALGRRLDPKEGTDHEIQDPPS